MWPAVRIRLARISAHVWMVISEMERHAPTLTSAFNAPTVVVTMPSVSTMTGTIDASVNQVSPVMRTNHRAALTLTNVKHERIRVM